MRTLRERVSNPAQYYRVTADSFRALCPEASGHMNMGLWPASSLRAAQEALVRYALDRAAAWSRRHFEGGRSRGILDLGSGWGASRASFAEVFPNTPYFGINLSEEQVEAARLATAHIPDTTYQVARVEDLESLPFERVDLLFSIEAAFHFQQKGSLLRAARERGVRCMTFFEICVEDPSLLNDPLLSPSLQNAWSISEYEDALVSAGFSRRVITDVTHSVFSGFLQNIDDIDPRQYQGRKAVLEQLRKATRTIVQAAEEGKIRYVLIQSGATAE